MTDRERAQLLANARAHLEHTRQGYVDWAKTKKGSEWKAAILALDRLAVDLASAPSPALGPVWRNGKLLLDQDLTHATDGLPLYPAFDDAFEEGRAIMAPEMLTVTRSGHSRPGLAVYATGLSKLQYWFGHLDRTHQPGTKIRKGDSIGKVAPNAIGGGPHVHVGVNVELLLGPGKELIHHTNYTHGAPTIGAQLRRAWT